MFYCFACWDLTITLKQEGSRSINNKFLLFLLWQSEVERESQPKLSEHRLFLLKRFDVFAKTIHNMQAALM
jgi:hypothetical protein